MWPFCGSQCDCKHVQYYLHRFCFFTTDSLLLRQTFLKDIRFTFGAGGFVCSLTEKELAEFHQHLESNFSFDNPCKVKKGLSYAGRQSDGVWIVNRELHISDDGAQIPLTKSAYSWQPIGGPCIELFSKNQMCTIDMQSSVELPLESKKPLHALLEAMKTVFKHNFIPST